MALADPRKLIGRFGLKEGMPLPFGFESARDFYEQMKFSAGTLHVFTYNFISDPQQFFGDLFRDCLPVDSLDPSLLPKHLNLDNDSLKS